MVGRRLEADLRRSEKTEAIGEKMLRLAESEADPQLELEGHLVVGPAAVMLGRGPEGLRHLDRVLSAALGTIVSRAQAHTLAKTNGRGAHLEK